MRSFRLAILTPRECVFEGEIQSLTLPTEDGLIGFLAGREQTVTEIVAGDLRFRDQSGAEYCYETDGGVFQMKKEEGVVLCGAAYPKESAAEKRREREETLAEEKKKQEQSLADYKLTRAALMRAFDKLKRKQNKN